MFYLLLGSEKYAEFTGATDADDRKVWWNVPMGDPLPPLEEWEPPTLVQYRGDGPKPRKPKKLPDCDGNYISHRAKEALIDIWDKHVLLYPVSVPEAPDPRYYMIVCTNILDCLDHEQSEFARRLNGVPYLLKNWIFKESVVGDSEIFRFEDNYPQSGMGYDIYVSEVFRERVIKAGLKGFGFWKFFGDPKPFVS